MNPRSTRSSTPSVSASRHRDGSSRSNPRSRAKWLRVPAEMTSNGMPCSAAIAGHQRLGPIPAGHPQQVGPISHRLTAQLTHVHGPRPLQQGHGGPQGLGLVLEAEPGHLPPTRARVHDQIGPPGRRDVVLAHPLGDRPRDPAPPGRRPRPPPAAPTPPPPTTAPGWCTAPAPPAAPGPPPRRPASGQGPCWSTPTTPRPRPGQADHPGDGHGQAGPQADRHQRHQHRRGGRHQGSSGPASAGQRSPFPASPLTGHHPRLPPIPPTVSTALSLDGQRPAGITPKGVRFRSIPGCADPHLGSIQRLTRIRANDQELDVCGRTGRPSAQR